MGTSASSGGSPTVVSPRTAEDNPRRGRARTFTVQRPISSAEALSTLILDMLEAREPSLASGRGLDLFMYYFVRELYMRIPPAPVSRAPSSPPTSPAPASQSSASLGSDFELQLSPDSASIASSQDSSVSFTVGSGEWEDNESGWWEPKYGEGL